METFYRPFILVRGTIQAVVYPMLGIEQSVEPRIANLERHLIDLFERNDMPSAAYQIIILWSDDVQLMTDVWLFTEIEQEDTGYTVDCRTFRALEPVTGGGLTASDGLIMLGSEAELSESIRKAGGSISDYFNSARPELPGGLISDRVIPA